jgi:hypothetical protein
MEVMVGRVEPGREVALGAEVVSLRAELQPMRVVAVAAGNAGRVHPALAERPVLVDFVPDLPVRKVEVREDELRTMRLEEASSPDRVGPYRRP